MCAHHVHALNNGQRGWFGECVSESNLFLHRPQAKGKQGAWKLCFTSACGTPSLCCLKAHTWVLPSVARFPWKPKGSAQTQVPPAPSLGRRQRVLRAAPLLHSPYPLVCRGSLLSGTILKHLYTQFPLHKCRGAGKERVTD